MLNFDINNLVRENIKNLSPYRSAREELTDPEAILLDANENPFPTEYNRYPDPFQRKLKNVISAQRRIPTNNLFLGNGSDEIIDLLYRAFCNPGKDSVIINVPTYGMYEVCAKINDIDVLKINLDDDFQLDNKRILSSAVKSKIIFVCSPNNPTGNIINKNQIIDLIENFKGLVVVDEAYIDFAEESSLSEQINKFPNLIVLQTFSKARGMAGIRLGLAFANSKIIDILNKIKYPYNISILNQTAALDALTKNTNNSIREILDQKKFLINELKGFSFTKKIWPSDSNFLLVCFQEHNKILNFLKKEGIIVRDRSNEPKCEGCLRISIGNSDENHILIERLKEFEQNIKSGK